MNYKRFDTVIGWLVFAVAAVTYLMTIEPTASFWDCSEFITSGYKLEVGHPPGAPIFMLTANLFTQFTSDPGKVAMMVNIMSALLSALCIMFLFWTITMLARKLVAGDDTPGRWQAISIFGAGIVGALAYTWSDTFWFSAVEGEVYAYSSFCTAVTFWLILKWEENCDRPHSARWPVLIAYLIGVSVGVHLLNLLCITAIVLVYYFKRAKEPDWKGGLLALLLSGVIIALVLYGIVPGIVKVGGWFELLFVNAMGLPFNTGLIVYVILLAAVLIWGVYETHRGDRKVNMYISFLLSIAMTGIPFFGHKASGIIFGLLILSAVAIYLFAKKLSERVKPSPVVLNTIMLSVMMITIGYSSYAVMMVRSTANPPMDQNSPEDIFSLGEYLAREQYGSTPLLYGQAYGSGLVWEPKGDYCIAKSITKGKSYGRMEKSQTGEKDSYYVKDDKRQYVYAQNMLFPRMYSRSAEHIEEYNSWCGGIKGKTYIYDACGRKEKAVIPTQLENLQFFVKYQINFMYWRYFMWNFAGRQNDSQNLYGEIQNGNWITGIGFIDRKLIGGDSKLMPEYLKGAGRNVFYCLPLLLGLIGLFWQFGKGKTGTRQFFVVLSLFFMTGLAIVVYLNQTPLQPRERDYAYAASFYAFAIWIGLGVTAISDGLRKVVGEKAAPLLAFLICLFVPIQMVSQTWDDHDRSGRYTCRDFGQNYLTTLPEKGNPIIFTNGDNDTFPLWYNLETEGFRTDTRVCNLSYLMTDWYIDQMKRPAYDSKAIPISFERIEYQSGTNEVVSIDPQRKYNSLKQARSEAEREWIYQEFELRNILDNYVKKGKPIPTDSIWLKIDKDAVLRSGMMIPKEYRGETDEETKAKMPDKMIISLVGKSNLMKNELMMLDMLYQCNWERPLFMATTVQSDNHLNLGNYFVLEGLAYRITPFDWSKLGYVDENSGAVLDSEKMYENLMKFKFGGLANAGVYLDETNRRMIWTHRKIYIQLAGQLINEGQNEKALEVLDFIEENLPYNTIPYHFYRLSTETTAANMYLFLNQPEKALPILTDITAENLMEMRWYLSMDNRRLKLSSDSFEKAATILYSYTLPQLEKIVDEETFSQTVALFDEMYVEYQNRIN